LLKDEVHGAKILIVNFLEIEVFLPIIFIAIDLEHWHSQTLTLAIEGVNLIVVGIIETLLWEILLVAIHDQGGVSKDLPGGPLVEEMMMGQGRIVEQVHVHQVVIDEGASDEWIREVVDRHRVVVQT
jgi:hypothetical protein